MKNIIVKNYLGNNYSGEWNEKTYSSAIQGREDLYRIYVSNQPCHITKNELEKISEDVKKINEETAEHLLEMALNLPDDQKKWLFVKFVSEDEHLAKLFKASVHEMLNDVGVKTNTFSNVINMLNCFEVYYNDINFL